MRTTINIDEDILLAAKEMARRKGVSIGAALSDMARCGLTRKTTGDRRQSMPLFPIQPEAGVVKLELINKLRDDSG